MTRKYGERTNGSKGYLRKVCLSDSCAALPSVIRVAFLSLAQQERGVHGLLLGRKWEGREFLHLLFPNCLQLKVINMPSWHFFEGCHIWIPFNSKETAIIFALDGLGRKKSLRICNQKVTLIQTYRKKIYCWELILERPQATRELKYLEDEFTNSLRK